MQICTVEFRYVGQLQSGEGLALLHFRGVRGQLLGSNGRRLPILVRNGSCHELREGKIEIYFQINLFFIFK